MSKSTMVELVVELEAIPTNDLIKASMAAIIAEAKAGEYHDFKNEKYVCGKVAVCTYLDKLASNPATPRAARKALRSLSSRVKEGEFDEEADAEDEARMRREDPAFYDALMAAARRRGDS